jgi:small subunit ribosomal protein S6
MFLFDPSVAREWSAIEEEVHRLCNRINAELLVCVKFDERKLAYEIERRKRGTYVLTYFEAEPDRITDLERDAGLSESILRLLVLRADDVPEARINELKVHPPETPLSPQSEGRRGDDDRGDRDRDRGDRDRGGRDRARGSFQGDDRPQRSERPQPQQAEE